ncbi:uncharacterized protein LOC122655317 [Telopea speciosissima]|uniref:uncharacterized protein LOC122655317 n=1 Tax=Telopea speciosissima TaxID=54955 RepID=UPI001CC3CEA2|nr:uncharacterized protein LOC122655317 [Telopea speciosissima]
MRENSVLKSWLWNSIEPSIAANVVFHKTVKGVWNDLKESFSQEKNISRTYELYENLFRFSQQDKSLNEYFSGYKGIIEELQVHQPLTTDLEQLKLQRAEFHVAKFLAGLHPDYQSVKSHLLKGEKVPSLNETFSQLQRLSTSSRADSAPSPKDSSAFIAGRERSSSFPGRGRGQGRGRGRWWTGWTANAIVEERHYKKQLKQTEEKAPSMSRPQPERGHDRGKHRTILLSHHLSYRSNDKLFHDSGKILGA